jgi:hypothetical protein
MIDMLKRHEIQVLRRAGHSQEEAAVGLQRGFGGENDDADVCAFQRGSRSSLPIRVGS